MDGRNGYNWIGKEQRAREAKIHTELMDTRYAREIQNSVSGTILYSGGRQYPGTLVDRQNLTDTTERAEMIVEETDSVSSLIRHKDQGKVCVLNFASYKNPGGMYLAGSRAQEECLCMRSFLYNVLRDSEVRYGYYTWNREHKNYALYLDRALYSPDIIFFGEDEMTPVSKVDVLTCAAPNWSAASKYGRISSDINRKTLEQRIAFIGKICASQHVDTFIAGAYGCGVFGQDPAEVAAIFRNEIGNVDIKKVIFAVPGGVNYEVFRKSIT